MTIENNSKPMGCSKSSSKREAYSNAILPQETRKILDRQLNFIAKTTGKRKTDKQTNKKIKLVEGKKS